jgi:hypothetical protein
VLEHGQPLSAHVRALARPLGGVEHA